jgi:hypothetical protein
MDKHPAPVTFAVMTGLYAGIGLTPVAAVFPTSRLGFRRQTARNTAPAKKSRRGLLLVADPASMRSGDMG